MSMQRLDWHSLRYRLALLIAGAATAVFFWVSYPVRESFEPHDVLVEGAILLTALVASLFVYRLEVEILEVGWTVFTYALIIDWLDELLQSDPIVDASLEGTLKVAGLALVVVGLYRSQTRLQEGLETSRTQLEAELRRSERMQRELRETNEKLSVLNRVLRHDIRNRVNVLTGYVELLDDEGNVEEVAPKIEAAAHEITELSEKAREIEQLIGEADTSTVELDVVPYVEEAVASVDRRWDGSIRVDVEAPDEARAKANELVGVAIENVFENAVQHGGGDDPVLEVVVRRDGEDVVVTVSDEGPGFPPGVLNVFERGTETPLEHVSGLGLWFSHWIVRDSGGELALENRDGGATVRISLPGA